MNTKAIENAQSLERFLNRHVLFVQGIDQNVPKSEVLQVLNQVCKQPQQGRVDVLTTPDGKMRGTAFLNFHNEEDAKAALEKWRFELELRGRPLRMQFSSDREFKDVIQGPLVARFKVLIRNLPEELTAEALFQMFSEYGEIIQVHKASDHYGQHYAIIQYLDISSVQAAIRHANRVRVLNHVLLVEPYRPNTTYGILPRNINQTQPTSASQQQSSSANGSNGGAPPASQGSGSPGGAATLPGTTYAALQQQQEREMIEQERYSYSQRQSESGSAAVAPSAGPSTSNGLAPAAPADAVPAPPGAAMAVPSFYASSATAAGGLHMPTAPGSLLHLLSTALHHVHALEEHLCCPITQEPLMDPVVAADGNTYERLAIEAWLQQHDTSPMTNEVLAHKALVPNNLLRKIAEELKGSTTPPAAVAADDGLERENAAVASVVSAPAVADGGVTAALADSSVPIPVPVPVPVQQPHPVAHQPTPQPHPQQHVGNTHVHHHIQAPTPQQQPQQPAPAHPHQQHQQQHQQHQQHHLRQQPMPQQHQYNEYGQIPVMRPQLIPTPVAFVHSIPQPTQLQVQGTTYYAYRPMGM